MKKVKLILAILLLLQAPLQILSQRNGGIKKSEKKVFILGKTYYMHKVRRGQTLYSLSNAYEVPIQQIISENSALLSSGLKSGMELKIPAVANKPENISKAQGDFIYHTVQPDQTLYFLSNKYNVSEDVILKNNPDIENGIIRLGQVLKIPRVETLPDNASTDYYFHQVIPDETLFSIAHKYRVDMQAIEELNPEIINGALKLGQTLKIPKGNYSSMETLLIDHNNTEEIKYYGFDPLYFEEEGTIPCKQFHYNRFMKFKIAVMLPLFINENSSGEKYYRNSERFYEIYQGLLMAANNMKKAGVSVELFVHDTRGDLNTTREILNRSDVANADLIIGPVYSKNFKLAANFAQQNKINIVSPVPLASNDLVYTNPFIFMTNPSMNTKVAKISDYIANTYDRSIVVVHNGTMEEEKIINLFKDRLVKSFISNENVNEIVFKQVNYKVSGIDGVLDALSIGLDNIVIIPSSDEAFITDIVTRLNFNKSRYKISIYGLKSWESFRNIQIEYLVNLNCHYGTTSYVDYNSKPVKDFIQQYRNAYNTEPGLYSYLGYDISYYFLSAMKKYGKHFQFCMPSDTNMRKNGLMYSFNYKRVSPLSGFENNWFNIININKDLKLVRVE